MGMQSPRRLRGGGGGVKLYTHGMCAQRLLLMSLFMTTCILASYMYILQPLSSHIVLVRVLLLL